MGCEADTGVKSQVSAQISDRGISFWRGDLDLTIESRVGKKYAIYLPKVMVKALNLKEGGKILLSLSGTSIVLESVQGPIHLAVHGRKFASITPDGVETISLEEQRSGTKNPA